MPGLISDVRFLAFFPGASETFIDRVQPLCDYMISRDPPTLRRLALRSACRFIPPIITAMIAAGERLPIADAPHRLQFENISSRVQYDMMHWGRSPSVERTMEVNAWLVRSLLDIANPEWRDMLDSLVALIVIRGEGDPEFREHLRTYFKDCNLVLELTRSECDKWHASIMEREWEQANPFEQVIQKFYPHASEFATYAGTMLNVEVVADWHGGLLSTESLHDDSIV